MHYCHSTSSVSSTFIAPFPISHLHLRSSFLRRIPTVHLLPLYTNQRSRFTLLSSINTNPNFNHNHNDDDDDDDNDSLRIQTLVAKSHSPINSDEPLSPLPPLPPRSLAMAEIDQLTSGASNRIIPIVAALRSAVVFLHALFLALFLAWRRRGSGDAAPSPAKWRRKLRRLEEEDTARRRALAEGLDTGDRDGRCRTGTSLFFGIRCNGLFCRSWVPVSGQMRGILIVIHGLNEHSGRYVQFAKQLNSCNFGVYAMDWIGHGGSDGLHGYVPSLDNVVADTGAFLEKIKAENPGVPCFLFGHSTGGSIVLKAASRPHIEEMVEGIVLTSPALRVKPSHPIVAAIAPIFSLVAPKYQFKGANKRGIPVTRDPVALLAKYSDPLVYTGPIRVRTGHEILRISAHLMRNFKFVTVPFLVLHGTADTVTDPLASQDLFNEAPSTFKDIKLYDGFLHDLLFEPEREDIARDIIDWMDKRLVFVGL